MTPARIRAIREAKGLSQARMADFMRVHLRTYCRWETGEARVTGPATVLLELLEKQTERN